MASVVPSVVDPQSMGSLKASICTWTGTVNNLDYWTSGIAGIVSVFTNACGTGVAGGCSWTASSGTIYFRPSVAITSMTALVLSKSF